MAWMTTESQRAMPKDMLSAAPALTPVSPSRLARTMASSSGLEPLAYGAQVGYISKSMDGLGSADSIFAQDQTVWYCPVLEMTMVARIIMMRVVTMEPACGMLVRDIARENGGSYVEPSSKHPGAMLFNLESLDVDVRDDEAHEHADANEANEDLNVKTTAECVSSNHQSANQADGVEKKSCIAHDAVDDDPFVADDWCELCNSEYCSREDASKMKQDSNLVTVEVEVVVAFTRGGAV
jgi:hypothetical protein